MPVCLSFPLYLLLYSLFLYLSLVSSLYRWLFLLHLLCVRVSIGADHPLWCLAPVAFMMLSDRLFVSRFGRGPGVSGYRHINTPADIELVQGSALARAHATDVRGVLSELNEVNWSMAH